MKCLSTRRTPEGFKRRRYQRDDGTRFNTIEVPEELWNTVNRKGLTPADRHFAVQARQVVKDAALNHLAAGWNATASAEELNVPVSTINRWRKEAK